MAIGIPRSLVEFILLGPTDDRRQLQDSPILGDVWIEFAREPDRPLDLLITPYKTQAAGRVAAAIADRITSDDSDIAYLQGVVAARLTFEEVLRVIVPMTQWWKEDRIQAAVKSYVSNPEEMRRDAKEILAAARAWQAKKDVAMRDVAPFDRYIALAGLIMWAQEQPPPEGKTSESTSGEQLGRILEMVTAENVADAVTELFNKIQDSEKDSPNKAVENSEKSPLIWNVSLNRAAMPALERSVPAVKADAARTLFTVSCREIVWAVIDSGIDGGHHAFKDDAGERSRVLKSFDFRNIRKIISLDNTSPEKRKKRIQMLLHDGLRNRPSEQDAEKALAELAGDARNGRPIHWELVENLVEIKPETPPYSNHGTHVAGIIGASKKGAEAAVKKAAEAAAKEAAEAAVKKAAEAAAKEAAEAAAKKAAEAAAGNKDGQFHDGMCPDIGLYDFRVLAQTIKDTEFAIIAVLQYIRHLNERNNFVTIHGANLSLSIPHDVRNFACGRTPICNECERLVDSGVVVVAAAGNRGYHSFETKEGSYEGYAAFSVTDPGNADGVITVGATHRYWPHTYGVSFFSSRGPTGDGRMKPDLVAPGERIRAPVPGNEWGDLDGTSMAAPHVSGAAAMLMARYSELIGRPRRIKQILCDSATDLGRERSFQGRGMLDVLRAFQSI